MKRIALIAALAATTILPASASAWTGNVFKSPSGNIICKYRGWTDSLSCGRWNDQRIVTMQRGGYAREGTWLDWRGDAVHTLTYGGKFTTPGLRYTCTSYINGMRCISNAGHGFFISRTDLNRW